MKIFIYEHLVAGGMTEAPASMIDEGVAMLKAAMGDFAKVAEPFTIASDEHIDRVSRLDRVRLIDGDPLETFKTAIEECDATLIIAPETCGALARLTSMAEFRGAQNLGCRAEAMEPTGNKLVFAERMEALEIAHPKTFRAQCFFDSSAISIGKWLTKPIYGAGCDGVRLHEMGAKAPMPSDCSVIAQEYIDGTPMSLSVIAGKDGPRIASVNRQFVREAKGSLHYLGGEVTENQPDKALEGIVEAIWKRMPGLRGFWGVDYVATFSGPVVIEVNPRLTTSYCALGAAIGVNPAELIMKAANGEAIEAAGLRRRVKFGKMGNLQR